LDVDDNLSKEEDFNESADGQVNALNTANDDEHNSDDVLSSDGSSSVDDNIDNPNYEDHQSIFPQSALVANDGLMQWQLCLITKSQQMLTMEEEQRCISRQRLMFVPLTIKPGHKAPLPHLLARISQ
jgi:hypothetical protein